MKLINVTTTELDLLIEVAHTTYREHYQYLWKDKGEHYIKTSYHKAAFIKELQDKNVGLYLITNEGTTYGYLKLNFDAPLRDYTAEEALELERIYLLKKATGKGLGKAVMNAVDSIAKDLDKKVVWLKTMECSDAQIFYRKCAYAVCGKTMLNVEGIYPQFQQQLIMEKIIPT